MTPDNSTLRAGEPLYCGYSGAAGKGCYDKSGAGLAAPRQRQYQTQAERLPAMKAAPPAPGHQVVTKADVWARNG